jgi:hypothetical protein
MRALVDVNLRRVRQAEIARADSLGGRKERSTGARVFGAACALTVCCLWGIVTDAVAGSGSKPRVTVSGSNISTTMAISPNWSGYVARSPKGHRVFYTSATATWTVPAAKCSAKGAKARTYSTTWVGLGGYAYETQEEVGTNSNCTAAGKGYYYSWFELVPYLSYPVTIKDTLHAGDVVTGLTKVLKAAKRVELQLKDLTAGWTFTTKISWAAPDETSADFVVEAPAECVYYTCTEASLANFGAVSMHGISIIGNGKSGSLTDPRFAVTGVKLVPGRLRVPTLNPNARTDKQGRAASPAGATPGPVSSDGRSFHIRWVKVATRGI